MILFWRDGRGNWQIISKHHLKWMRRENLVSIYSLNCLNAPLTPSADRKSKRPFGAAPAGAPRSTAESGPERPGEAAQDGGRVAPQGRPGAQASGRAVVEGWEGEVAHGMAHAQRCVSSLGGAHVAHETT